MEDKNGSVAHQLSDLVKVMQESLLQQSLVIDIDGTLDVPSVILVVEATIYDNHWMGLLLEQVGKCLTLDWVAGRCESVLKVQLLKQSR